MHYYRNYEFCTILKICVITAEIKKNKSTIRKKKKKHDKILFPAKSKLHSVEVLICKALIDSDITHNEILSINKLPDKVDETKNSNDKWRFKLYIKQCSLIVWSVEKMLKSKNSNTVKSKNGRIMLLSKCAVFNSKKPNFIKEQETRGLLTNLTGIKIPILGGLPLANTLF